jgi:hypothetical protein
VGLSSAEGAVLPGDSSCRAAAAAQQGWQLSFVSEAGAALDPGQLQHLEGRGPPSAAAAGGAGGRVTISVPAAAPEELLSILAGAAAAIAGSASAVGAVGEGGAPGEGGAVAPLPPGLGAGGVRGEGGPAAPVAADAAIRAEAAVGWGGGTAG